MFRNSLASICAGTALPIGALMADYASASTCPGGDGPSVANLAAAGVATAPGLAAVTLRWQPTTPGKGARGYLVVVSAPVFDYQIDKSVLNPTNLTDPLVINPVGGNNFAQTSVSAPPGSTGVTVPNLAPLMPYVFTVWTPDDFAAFQAAQFTSRLSPNPVAVTQLGACLATSVSVVTGVVPPPTAPVWGFADTHTHPFANDAYDQNLIFVGKPFGPKWESLDQDIGCTPTCPPDPHYLHQGLITGQHLQSFGLNARQAGWPDFDHYPSYNISLHQAMYSDWLYRAFLGGLKLIVAHAVNNEVLCNVGFVTRVANSNGTCNDMASVDRQIADAKAMEAYLNLQCPVTNPPRCLAPFKGWYHIVSSPDEARRTINGGQLAVVLGIEVDRLFGCRASARGLSDSRDHDCSQDDAPTEAYLTQQVQKYRVLGVRHVFIAHLSDSAFGGMALYDSGQFFPFSGNNIFVNGSDLTTEACSRAGYGFNFNQHQGIFGAFNPSGFPGSVLQSLGITPPANGNNYPVPTCNARGLTPLGRFLVRTLLQNGIMIDFDHLSLETWGGANGLLSMLNYTNESDQRRPYTIPLVAGHTGPTGLSGGNADERGLSDEALTYLRESYGLPAMGVGVGAANVDNTYNSAQYTSVSNNCDSSSASFAQGYLYFVDAMGGPNNAAVAVASDQSLNNLVAPRFNAGRDPHSPWMTPNYSNGCGGNQAQSQGQGNPINFVQGAPIGQNGPPSWYFSAAAGAGPNPPRVFLWTGERDYNLNAKRMWDYNVDGLAHVGLYPELIQDLQDIGVKPQEIAPLYRSAERYIDTWQSYSSGGILHQTVPFQMGTVGPIWNSLLGVGIKTSVGTFLTAIGGGGLGGANTALQTDRTLALGWETFLLIPNLSAHTFSLQTINGNFVTAIGGGGIGGSNDNQAPIHTDASTMGAWERFSIVGPVACASQQQFARQIASAFNGAVCVRIKTANGHFVTAVGGGGYAATGPNIAIDTNRTQPEGWETFQWVH